MTNDSRTFGIKSKLPAGKDCFLRTFVLLTSKKTLVPSLGKKYANLTKNLLPSTNLTIIIRSLVIRINSCQNDALDLRKVFEMLLTGLANSVQ